MSLFRKPKKIQRRVFSSAVEDDEDGTSLKNGAADAADGFDGIDEELVAPPPPIISGHRKSEKKDKNREEKRNAVKGGEPKAKALLSFADEEEDDAEVFQVRKSSHSKKVMRMMDKERRKKRREERDSVFESSEGNGAYTTHGRSERSENRNDFYPNSIGPPPTTTTASATTTTIKEKTTTNSKNGGKDTGKDSASVADAHPQCKNSKKTDPKTIQTEIRTDDFVLVVKKSEPELVLNGRAAICAGRNDLTDDEDQENSISDHEQQKNGSRHRFSKPKLKQMLESGSIPDAAMIHAARKRRQKAREEGDFIAIEEPKEEERKGSRLAREDVEGDMSDEEERVTMNAIMGVREREERREQFYAVENDCTEEDSDHETNEWENQQIRKGVTGAQLVSAQQESVLSRFMIKPPTLNNALTYGDTEPLSTSTLLEEAYAKSALQTPLKILTTNAAPKERKKEKVETKALRTPQEIREALRARLQKLKDLHQRHVRNMDDVVEHMNSLKTEEASCDERAPTAAAKYRFYQEIKCYVTDLVDCLNDKVPQVNLIEERLMQHFSKYQNFLIERRRQDVRDQVKEMAEASKPTSSRRPEQDELQVRRAAEREGRRTRRRCERERNGLLAAHLDGMSSDDETADRYQEQLQNSLEQIEKEAEDLFGDAHEEFYKVDFILKKLYVWRRTDMEAYKDAFVSICLPKVLGPLVRYELISWSPLQEEYKELDAMCWYEAAMMYAYQDEENEESLRQDPDLNLVPTIIEKIIIPKVSEIVNQCWDPLSTTQTLRLIGFVKRLGRDYPLKRASKSMHAFFNSIVDKMKLALENDVFIPIFPKQVQEAKTSFFQRQFCSGLKLFRNFLSWQGIIADKPLRELAIGSLLNRYLLLAMRVCSPNDAINKAYVIVNTLPTVWLQPESETLKNLNLFSTYIKQLSEVLSADEKNIFTIQTIDKAKQILQRLHSL